MKHNLKESAAPTAAETSSSASSELVKRTEVPNSPFVVITTEEGSFGTLGNYRITEISQDPHGLVEELEKFTWNRVVQLIGIILDNTNIQPKSK